MKTLEQELKELLAGSIGTEANKIQVNRKFYEQSIGATDLELFRSAIQNKYRIRVPNLLWEYPSIEYLHAYLLENLGIEVPLDLPAIFSTLSFQEGLPDALFYE